MAVENVLHSTAHSISSVCCTGSDSQPAQAAQQAASCTQAAKLSQHPGPLCEHFKGQKSLYNESFILQPHGGQSFQFLSAETAIFSSQSIRSMQLQELRTSADRCFLLLMQSHCQTPTRERKRHREFHFSVQLSPGFGSAFLPDLLR